MTNTVLDKLLPAGMIAWLVVGGAGTAMLIHDGDDWHLRYVVFAIALLVGAAVLFGAGFCVLAVVDPARRREFATFAAAQFGGLGVFLGAAELGVATSG